MPTTMNRSTLKLRSRPPVQTLALDTAVMDQLEQSLFESISPDSLSSSLYSVDYNEDKPSVHRKRSGGSVELSSDSPNGNGEINDSLRRQRRKEQNRAAQRAYRERKVNHTMELEGRINYLEVHIEELKDENQQLEATISQTRVENGVLRNNLHASRQSMSTPKSPIPPIPPPTHMISNNHAQAKPVLVKDLLRLYGPHADDAYS